jgi:hypothetical protein
MGRWAVNPNFFCLVLLVESSASMPVSAGEVSLDVEAASPHGVSSSAGFIPILGERTLVLGLLEPRDGQVGSKP